MSRGILLNQYRPGLRKVQDRLCFVLKLVSKNLGILVTIIRTEVWFTVGQCNLSGSNHGV